MSDKLNINIRPMEINPTVDCASDTEYTFVIVDPSGDELDLTDYTFLMELRPYARSKRLFDTMSTENGRITCEGGKVTLKFPAAATAGYKFDTAVYDLVAISTDGLRYRLAEGQIEFYPEVTNALV